MHISGKIQMGLNIEKFLWGGQNSPNAQMQKEGGLAFSKYAREAYGPQAKSPKGAVEKVNITLGS